MTYLSFHLVFTLPPILVGTVLFIYWKGGDWLIQRSKAIGLLALIAVTYTTPWDNYLVYKDVWMYGPERVLATIGYVPVEEYAFFILQTLLTGLVLLAFQEIRGFKSTLDSPPPTVIVALLLGLVSGAGVFCLFGDATLYLGLILAWAAPVLLGQWILGSKPISQGVRYWVPTVAAATIYLAAADRFAISVGTWSISERFTTGYHLFGLPVEEALFFFMTNMMVVWGLILFEHYQRSPNPA